jgi:hypothetical protein
VFTARRGEAARQPREAPSVGDDIRETRVERAAWRFLQGEARLVSAFRESYSLSATRQKFAVSSALTVRCV